MIIAKYIFRDKFGLYVFSHAKFTTDEYVYMNVNLMLNEKTESRVNGCSK